MKLNKLQDYLVKNNYDGILLRRRNHFSWLTGGRNNYIAQNVPDGIADFVIMKDEAYLVTSRQEERRILDEECSKLPFKVKVLADDWYTGTDALIEKIAQKKRMVTDIPFADWKVVYDDLIELRSRLSEEEILFYRELCRESAKAVEETCKEIKPGQTEHEIAAHLAQKVMASGIRIQVLLVATDERVYRYRHPIPTNKRLNKHAMIVLCAERGGLVANVTRLVHFGPMPDELKSNAEKLSRIDIAMNGSTRPGKTAGDVICKAIAEYERAGFPSDWKKLHQGGLTGYESREYFATPDSREAVVVNQAFAWNPSLPGVKSEDTMLVREDGNEFLTETGDWVYQNVDYEGNIYKRPGIYVR